MHADSRSLSRLTRRSALGLLGAGAAALALPAASRATGVRLALYGPPAGPTVTLAYAVAHQMLAEVADDVTLTVWRNPDELRAGLTSGAIDLSVVPAQAAANLYNRGMGLRLVNVMTNGLLYIMAPEGGPSGLAALAGQRIAVPFVNDTPDLILRALLEHHKLQAELVPAGNPTEAAQMLLAGRVAAALLSEPVATVVQIRGGEAGRPMARAVDIQREWGELTGLGPVVPQAGLAVTRGFTERHGDRLPQLQAAMVAATAKVLADPAAGAKAAAGPLEQPVPMLTRSIPHCNLTATPASEARPALEAMFQLMAKADPALLGGKLPDDGFYAL
ncbi:MAG: ABC transporter substrate-binding protein [Pigmentiphaga sp.]